ncbi:DUF6049 family protein [Amycolatopsis suaedae]|uniref:Glycoprotein n=1 Tax=Amycolatopsis suaedae TaxID=2510978 RepID=A0A4Q7JEA5_9PSEU|nr:DUF6049 family protein [Amycolatopsis suaedae]RZQ65013.1 glycoprotein [Amycolatopsis suaedae]
MRRLAAVVLAAFLLVLHAITGVAAAQPVPEGPSRLRLDVEQMNPRVVRSTSQNITIAGKVTNVGDRRITNVRARIQIGERQTSQRQVAEALAEAPPADASQPNFVPVADVIEPGQQVPFNITVNFGDELRSLPVNRPGVYPLLVNVNGTPEFGGPARLAALSMLLPALGAPGQAAPAKPAKATPLSILWPITDSRPRVLDAPLGGPLVLADDQLAADLSAGGRLDGLLAAARSAEGSGGVFSSLCFAVDPDLLGTVERMTRGYQVRTDGGTVEGRGVNAAQLWLNSFKQLAGGHCVVQLPFADADLPGLRKVTGGAELVKQAVDGSAIERILGVKPLPGVLWPGGGLTADTLDTLGEAGVRTVITEPGRLPGGAAVIEGTQLRGQPLNDLLTTAMAGGTSAAGTSTPAGQPAVAAQNGIAALAFLTGLNQQGPPNGPLILSPPRRWTATGTELDRLLDTVNELTTAGFVDPTPLTDVLEAPVEGTAAMDYTKDAPVELPGAVIESLGTTEHGVAELTGAMAVDPLTRTQPAVLTQPLREAVIRATSTASRGDTGAALAGANLARDQFDAMRRKVTIETPGQPITLASGSSPLPVFIKNGLPVGITVQLTLNNNTGLRTDPVQPLPIPAMGQVQQFIQAEALRTGRFTVDVSLATTDGIELGSPQRFDLTSSEFGLITVILTATAGVALVLLAGRRIYRRIRERRPR